MRAFPSLFVGLATLLAGCSWNNLQTDGLAGPQPVPQSDPWLPSSGEATAPSSADDSNVPSIPDPIALAPVVELGRASNSPPPLAAEPSAASARAVAGQTTAQSDVWRAAYESHGHRPIHTFRVGEGERRILVTGSLHGDDAESVWLLDAITARLTPEPIETPTSRCLFLRTPNPDGLAAAQRWNANGVDLNRNFPSLRFIPLSDSRNGAAAASAHK